MFGRGESDSCRTLQGGVLESRLVCLRGDSESCLALLGGLESRLDGESKSCLPGDESESCRP